MGFYATLLMTVYYPLYLVKSESVISVGQAAQGFEEFVVQLEFLPFRYAPSLCPFFLGLTLCRNAFRDFLALQFCQENILFYENAFDWKRMNANDSERTQIALAIRDNVRFLFIIVGILLVF
jgi:hypothetical protein